MLQRRQPCGRIPIRQRRWRVKRRAAMAMNDQLKAMIANERKNARELKELRDLRKKEGQKKQPDPKLLAMIDAEIQNYQGGKIV